MECRIFDVPCMFDSVVLGVVGFIAQIPVPAVMEQQIVFPAVIGFWADAFQFPEGFAIIMGAYTARFLVRRIPVIG